MAKKSRKELKQEQEQLIQKTALGVLKKHYDEALSEPDEGQRLIKLDDVRKQAEVAGAKAKQTGTMTGFGKFFLGYNATAIPIILIGDMAFGGLPVFTLLGAAGGMIVGGEMRDKKRRKIVQSRSEFIAAIKEIEDNAAFGVNSLIRRNALDYSASPALPEIFTRFPGLKDQFVEAQACKKAQGKYPGPGYSSKDPRPE